MMYQCLTFVLLASIAQSDVAIAQRLDPYTVPRTEHGHPDFQGVWATAFLTPLERPAGVDKLVVSHEEAAAVVTTIRALMPALIDPQVNQDGIDQLATVRGEYRASLIVEPKNGAMPLTKAGVELAAWVRRRNTQMFDRPDQRPLNERCMENLGYAPIRTLPVFLPRQILQTDDHVVIVSEDAPGVRLIHLRSEPLPDSFRSVEGYSEGKWEGDTLVVHTSHFRDEDPARNVAGRPLLIGRNTRITERFTRVSETELFYRFTVEDAALYTQPWTGEFSMTRYAGPIYEYACHEGNYSMPNALRGGQAEAAAREADATRRGN